MSPKRKASLLLPSQVCDTISFEIQMLLSVNKKYGTNSRSQGRGMYVRGDYRRAEAQAVEDLQTQLAAINQQRLSRDIPIWTPLATDRYIILYAFDFPGSLKQDMHNPLKPTCDLLKKAGIIFEDNRVFQEELEKRTKVAYPWARITVYRIHEKLFRPVPFQSLIEGWLAEHYTLPERITLTYDKSSTQLATALRRARP